MQKLSPCTPYTHEMHRKEDLEVCQEDIEA